MWSQERNDHPGFTLQKYFFYCLLVQCVWLTIVCYKLNSAGDNEFQTDGAATWKLGWSDWVLVRGTMQHVVTFDRTETRPTGVTGRPRQQTPAHWCVETSRSFQGDVLGVAYLPEVALTVWGEWGMSFGKKRRTLSQLSRGFKELSQRVLGGPPGRPVFTCSIWLMLHCFYSF